jgi:hypothetical protein
VKDLAKVRCELVNMKEYFINKDFEISVPRAIQLIMEDTYTENSYSATSYCETTPHFGNN